jgi:hypothetical protein
MSLLFDGAVGRRCRTIYGGRNSGSRNTGLHGIIPTSAIPTPLVGQGRSEVKWSGVSFGGVGSGLVGFERCRLGSSRVG